MFKWYIVGLFFNFSSSFFRRWRKTAEIFSKNGQIDETSDYKRNQIKIITEESQNIQKMFIISVHDFLK